MTNPYVELLKMLSSPFLTPEEVAQVLKCDAHSLRVAARQRPELLGFPVNIMGHRVRIPRVPFLNFVTGGTNE